MPVTAVPRPGGLLEPPPPLDPPLPEALVRFNKFMNALRKWFMLKSFSQLLSLSVTEIQYCTRIYESNHYAKPSSTQALARVIVDSSQCRRRSCLSLGFKYLDSWYMHLLSMIWLRRNLSREFENKSEHYQGNCGLMECYTAIMIRSNRSNQGFRWA